MKTNTIIRKMLSLLLVLTFILTLIPVSSVHIHAADSESLTYLALGDSISTGYGLAGYTPEAHSTEGFAYQLASELGYTLNNKAVDGNTSADILEQLNNASHAKYVSAEELTAADVISITVGGNDLMALLYAKIAEQTTSTTDTAKDMPALLQAGNTEALLAAINLLTASQSIYIVNDPDFEPAINAIINNLNAIVEKIRSVNSHAQIVVATQYNPYVEFKGAVFLFLRLDAVFNGMEAGVTALNEAIVKNAKDKYTVSDVKAAFDGYTGTEDLYNAQPPAGTTTINVDFHPTAAGHDLLASSFKATFEALDITDAPKTVTVDAPYDTMMIAGVTGAGTYNIGESVTLTATTVADNYHTMFYYWLDNSVTLSQNPTEEELEAAIVSYSPTFTFTATKNASYTPVADFVENKLQVYIEGCLFEDDSFTSDGEGWGYTTEYDQVLPVGDEEVVVSIASYPETLTVEGKLYLRMGFAVWDFGGESEGSLVLLEDASITVPKAPIYNSAEYWIWREEYANITVAYLFHTHNYETRFDADGHWEECSCGDKTERVSHSLTDNACTECDYSVHSHSYETKYDDTHHWDECSCGDEQNKAEHSYTDNADTTCDCGHTRTIVTFNVTYADGVADAEIFADQVYTVTEGNTTPTFDGTPTRQGFIFLGWTPEVAETVTATAVYTARWGEALTIPLFDGDKTAYVNATAEGSKAILHALDPSALELFTGSEGTVSFDFSDADTNAQISNAALPSELLEQLRQRNHGFEITLSNGVSASFDTKQIVDIVESDFVFSAQLAGEDDLTDAQKNAVGNRPAYDITVYSGDNHISDMGGDITVHVPYELNPGEKPEGIVVWYVDQNGNKEKCETSYDNTNKRVNWTTNHLSLYMIGYEEPMQENTAPADPLQTGDPVEGTVSEPADDPADLTWLWITLPCVAVVIISAVVFAVIRKKKAQ